MIERIDLFLPPRSRYQVLHYFTRSLAEALTRVGVRCLVLEAEYDNPKPFIDQILADPPECTLSLNGLLPDVNGNFFCDLINIPHVAYLVDAPQDFAALTQSPLSIIATVDRFYCDFFEGINGQSALFIPHGVNQNLMTPPNINEKRPYDVLFLASYLDYEEIRDSWKKNLSSALCKTLEEAAEITLGDKETPYIQALAEALDRQSRLTPGLDPRKIDFIPLLDQLEDYIVGKDRVELIKAIKDAKVHIYGANSESWKKHLVHQKNIAFHDAVDYDEALNLMKKSKIVLNTCPKIKNGAHERIFAGIASGAVVITDENVYMRENFKHGEDILFDRHGHWHHVNALINEYLLSPEKCLALVQKGQEVVSQGHTWDYRAVVLVSELGPMLDRLGKDKGL